MARPRDRSDAVCFLRVPFASNRRKDGHRGGYELRPTQLAANSVAQGVQFEGSRGSLCRRAWCDIHIRGTRAGPGTSRQTHAFRFHSIATLYLRTGRQAGLELARGDVSLVRDYPLAGRIIDTPRGTSPKQALVCEEARCRPCMVAVARIRYGTSGPDVFDVTREHWEIFEEAKEGEASINHATTSTAVEVAERIARDALAHAGQRQPLVALELLDGGVDLGGRGFLRRTLKVPQVDESLQASRLVLDRV